MIGIGAVLGLLRFDSFQVGAFQDDAHYVVLAKALAAGQGFRLISFPDAPAEPAFPPGWPLLLSPLAALSPDSFTPLKLLSFAFFLASIPLTYRLFARRLPAPYPEMVAAFVALHPALVATSGMLMSEAAYLFFSLATLNLLEYADRLYDQKPNVIWIWAGVGGLAVYSQSIRTIGLSLIVGISLYLLVSRRFRAFGVFAAACTLGLAGQYAFSVLNGGALVSHGYESQVFNNTLSGKLAQAGSNLAAYADLMIADLLIPIFGGNIQATLERLGLGIALTISNLLLMALLAGGFALSLRRLRAADLYVVVYFAAILMFWNPDVGSAQTRFLLPILPFLYGYVLTGLARPVSALLRSRPTTVNRAFVAASVPVFLLLVARNVQEWRNPIRNRTTDLSIGADWIHGNTPADAVVMAREPVPSYLYTDRRTVAYPPESVGIYDFIKARGVDVVLISPPLQTETDRQPDADTQSRLLPALLARPEEFRQVFHAPTENVRIFQRRGGLRVSR